MQFRYFASIAILGVCWCLLAIPILRINAAENDDEELEEWKINNTKDDHHSIPISGDITKNDKVSNSALNNDSKNNLIINENEDENEDEDDAEDDGEDDTCDTSLNSFVRRFNATPFLPDDYEQVYEQVSQMDLINRKYNITEMITILERSFDYIKKISKNKDIADTGMYLSSVMMDRLFEAKVSAECTADLANIGQGLRNLQLWSAKCI